MSQIKRKICVITGSRAEYGHLYWLMKEIQSDPAMELQTLVMGMHVSKRFGMTYKMIQQDGFTVNKKINLLLKDDSPVSTAKSFGLAVYESSRALKKLNPNIAVILGDRYDILAAAVAAMLLKIPIAHISGGEITEGAIDDAIRHSLTKLSHLHFVASEPYRQRVVQLGESPERVSNFGAPGLDNIDRLQFLDRSAVENALNFKLGPVNFLVTYHPVTLEGTPEFALQELLLALDEFPEAKIVFTKSNSDPLGAIVGPMLENYVKKNKQRTIVFTSLGQLKYLSLMRQVDVVVGNSSSGIIEAPVVKTATVNLGNRQKGRLRSSSIIDCKESKNYIVSAIKKALTPEFKNEVRKTISPYGQANASVQIKEVLKKYPLEHLLFKKFYDVPNQIRATRL